MDAASRAALIARIKALPPPTERQQEEQRLSFAYGNLACSTNHKPSRSAFRNLIREKYGWSEEAIEAWIAAREWEVD